MEGSEVVGGCSKEEEWLGRDRRKEKGGEPGGKGTLFLLRTMASRNSCVISIFFSSSFFVNSACASCDSVSPNALTKIVNNPPASTFAAYARSTSCVLFFKSSASMYARTRIPNIFSSGFTRCACMSSNTATARSSDPSTMNACAWTVYARTDARTPRDAISLIIFVTSRAFPRCASGCIIARYAPGVGVMLCARSSCHKRMHSFKRPCSPLR